MREEEVKSTNRTDVANAEKLVGMAKDIEYIKIAMDDLKKLVADIKDGYTTKVETTALAERVRVLELIVESNNKWIERSKGQLAGYTWLLGFFGSGTIFLVIKTILDSVGK